MSHAAEIEICRWIGMGASLHDLTVEGEAKTPPLLVNGTNFVYEKMGISNAPYVAGLRAHCPRLN